MANIINAIVNIISNPQIKLVQYAVSHNRANNMGEALEEYVKDAFADTVGEKSEKIRLSKISKAFSYLGNQNNPPDSMLRDGDAIEVKKIESNDSHLALNSSYPKAKLFANSPMISKACRNCECWNTKDMIYAVGVVRGMELSSLAFVYGDDYCAESSTYERIKSTIKMGVESIPGVEFSATKELGRINRVDPLGITYLRIRGMWGIENPFTTFNYIYKRDFTKSFNFMAVINSKKYYSFNNYEELEILEKNMELLKIEDVKIKNPNNPALMTDAKLISFMV